MIKRILKLIIENNKRIIWYSVFSIVITTIINTIQVYFPKIIIESVNKENSNFPIIVAVSFCIIVVTLYIVNILLSYFKSKKQLKMHSLLNNMLNKVLLESDYQIFETFEYRKNISLATECIKTSKIESVCDNIVLIISNALSVLSLIYLTAFLSWWFWILMTVSMFVNIVFGVFRIKNDFENHKKINEVNPKMLYARDRLTWYEYAKEVRLFQMYKYIKYTAEYYINELSVLQKEASKKTFSFYFICYLFDFIQRVFTFSFAVNQLYNSKITVAEFSMIILALISISALTRGISNNIVNILDSYKYIASFVEVAEYDSEEKNIRNALLQRDMITIRFENVYFRYPDSDRYALEDINHTFSANKKYGLVGENGSGKTTFIMLLMRLYKPTSGTIYLNDIDISEYDIKKYYSLFAPVFQDCNLYAYTILENVTMFSKECNCNIHDLLSLFDLDELPPTDYLTSMYDNGREISGGQSQKLAFARALYKNSEIFILDEPTSALSADGERQIYDLLKNKLVDKTIFFISHRMASCKMCDEIIVFNKGSISEYGDHKSLIHKNGLYAKMFDAQAGLYAINGNTNK